MPRRLFIIRKRAAFVFVKILFPSLGIPFLGGSFLLSEEAVVRLFGKVEHASSGFLASSKGALIFIFQECSGPFSQLGEREDGIKAIIVLGWQRIELVVVAFEASHSGAEESLPNRVDHIVEIELSGLRFKHHGGVPRAHSQKGGRDQELRILFLPF